VSRTKIPSLSSSDPVRVAWRYLAVPEFSSDSGLDESNSGVCARCEVITVLMPIQEVVSSNFTGWEGLAPEAQGLCESCSWSFRESRLRINAVLVHSELGAVWASRDQVTACLQVPLTEEVALSVPILGKKHLLPYSEWGTVVGDDGALPWREPEAKLTCVVVALRSFGVRESEMGEPVPPYRVVSDLLADTQATLDLMAKWEELRPWQGTPQFAIAIRGTRPEKVLSPVEVESGEAEENNVSDG